VIRLFDEQFSSSFPLSGKQLYAVTSTLTVMSGATIAQLAHLQAAF